MKTQEKNTEHILIIHKERGETLAVLLTRVRQEHMLGPSVPLTYAGRLDPMASGLMIILVGETCKQKENYLGLEKTYRFSVLFGVATDTYDVLGKVVEVLFPEQIVRGEVERALTQIHSTASFPYPPYSSRTVEGVPLFVHARKGTLPNSLPMQTGSIQTLVLKNIQSITLAPIVDSIVKDIGKVQGDFRQADIIQGWREIGGQYPATEVYVVECEAVVSSGMYIRTIASMLGERVGVPSLAYTIERVRVGEYL